MLMPDVTAVIDDPDLGGGVAFEVVRQSRKRTLAAGGTPQISNLHFPATGNVQPASTQDLTAFPEELRSTRNIVIRSTFKFELGKDDGSSMTSTDIVIHNNECYKVVRIDRWHPWGFQTVYAALQKGVSPNDYQ